MPLNNQNPITSYFPRISKQSTSSQDSSQDKRRRSKRVRQPDASDSGKENSRKKSRNRKLDDDDLSEAYQAPSSSHPQPLCPRRPRNASGTVIDVSDSPPNSPVKSASKRFITPPSSPLPELTPSPEPIEPGERLLSTEYSSCSNTPCPSSTIGNLEYDIVPSSQTQILDFSYDDTRYSVEPTPSAQLRNSGAETVSRRSQILLLSHSPDVHPTTSAMSEELVASSQSQIEGQIATSPVDDTSFEFVPTSQTVELSHSQVLSRPPLVSSCPPSSDQRTSHLDAYSHNSPFQSRSTLFTETEISLLQQDPSSLEGVPTHSQFTIPSSQSPSCASRPSSPSNMTFNQTQPRQQKDRWEDESSDESLPDAVKEFQEMFSGTFESYPPDFPMSLR